MKKILFITAIVLAAAGTVMLSACGKSVDLSNGDNNSSAASTTSIVGLWYYSTDTVNVYSGSTLQSTTPSSYFQTSYLQFNSNGSGTLYQNDVTSAFSFALSTDNKVLTLRFASNPNINSLPAADAAKAAGARTLETNAYQEVAAIKTLTATNLVLYFDTVSGSTTTTESAYLTKAN